MVNKRDEYSAVAQLQQDDARIIPMLELTAPQRAPVRLGGSIVNKNGRRLVIDLNLENVAKDPVSAMTPDSHAQISFFFICSEIMGKIQIFLNFEHFATISPQMCRTKILPILEVHLHL